MKRLTLSKAKKVIKSGLGIPACKLRESENCKGVYIMELGEMYISVNGSRPFGAHEDGEYIEVVVGMLPDKHMDFLFDGETMERDFIAEDEMERCMSEYVLTD